MKAVASDRSRQRMALALASGLVVASSLGVDALLRTPETSDVFESVYNHVIVEREGTVVNFRRMETGGVVSAIDLADPRRQVTAYTGVLFAAALAKPDPKSVLSIGLGAGALNRLFGPAFPDAKLTTVEVDPMIVRIAASHTGFREGPNDEVVIGDGRRHIARSSATWDWVVVDAFVRDSQVPFHLTTADFFRLVERRLSGDGVLVLNLHRGTLFYESQLRTLRDVFKQVLLFRVPRGGTVIVAAVKYAEPDALRTVKDARIQALPDLRSWGVDFAAMAKSASHAHEAALSDRAELLTDDFAPVEYLASISDGAPIAGIIEQAVD